MMRRRGSHAVTSTGRGRHPLGRTAPEGDDGPWRHRLAAGKVASRGTVMIFADRADARCGLAARLMHLGGGPVVVLGLPRGGVSVAREVARALGAPQDVIVMRKLGVPFQPERGHMSTRRWRATPPVTGPGGRAANRAPIGYFGASTGAAAALAAAAEPGTDIGAVVSRGGRPDLAGPRLAAVTAPMLLIVGGNDEVTLIFNRQAQAELNCENKLAIMPGATHLFEEPGTLDATAALARGWFLRRLTRSPQSVT